MKALVLEGIKKLVVQDVPKPEVAPVGALIKVMANGVCRSDWHYWVGDQVRGYPLIMGHEMTGVIEEVAPGVTRFKKGDRVIVPFSGSDGTCHYCQAGLPNLCDNRMFPGFAYSGGYAEYVSVPLADRNLVHLPDEISFAEGAALGCRFMTSYHGLIDRVQVQPGEWVVVYGCGGIGLSAVNVAASVGARVIGVDINPDNLDLARKLGASHVINSKTQEPVAAIKQITGRGAHVAVDALGISETCVNGLMSLRRGGRHLQVGLTTKREAGYINIPIDAMVRDELALFGSLGMPPFRFESMVPMVASGSLAPGKMLTGEVSLSDVEGIFEAMSNGSNVGTFVVTKFE